MSLTRRQFLKAVALAAAGTLSPSSRHSSGVDLSPLPDIYDGEVHAFSFGYVPEWGTSLVDCYVDGIRVPFDQHPFRLIDTGRGLVLGRATTGDGDVDLTYATGDSNQWALSCSPPEAGTPDIGTEV